jgi:hypothetical protein
MVLLQMAFFFIATSNLVRSCFMGTRSDSMLLVIKVSNATVCANITTFPREKSDCEVPETPEETLAVLVLSYNSDVSLYKKLFLS